MDSDEEEVKAPKHTRWPIVVIGLLILIAAGVFVASRVLEEPRGQTEAPVAADAGVPAEGDAGPSLSLDDGDALLKKLASGWSSHPKFLKWLESLGLRALAAAVQLVAEGESPRPALPFVSITGPFAVREEAPAAKPARVGKRRAAAPPGRLFIAPESYARYDEVTQVVTSVNAAAVGDAWAQLRPFVEVAYREIGRPGTHFDDTLTVALRRLLTVNIPQGEVELVPEGAVYGFKDPQLQSASKAEKHLLRMGPKNGRAIQAVLRDFATHAHLDIGP